MFGTQHLAVFAVSGILLNLTPGQDTLYIVGRSLSQGRKAGLLSVTGIISGAIIHTLFAAFGISGGLFIFNGTLWCLVLVWIASSISRSLRQHPSSGLMLKRATGAIFVGLGVRLAASK